MEVSKIFWAVCLSFLLASASAQFDDDDDMERDHTGCPMTMEGRCKCKMEWYKEWNREKKVFLTLCNNTGFTDVDILANIPAETEVLVVTGNHFHSLPWNIFGIWNNYSKLEVIDLTNNGIKEIQGKTFHKVTNVKRLILNHNELYIVSKLLHTRIFSNFINLEELHLTNAFTERIESKWTLQGLKDIFLNSQLTKLRKLHLEQNEIWTISDPDEFCQLPSLLDLYLGDNQLTEINFSLSCLRQLRFLDLSYNKVKNLRKSTLNMLDDVFGRSNSTAQIDLHGNPFVCDCQMSDLRQWLIDTNTRLANKDEMRCYEGYPEYNAGKKIKNVAELECGPDSITSHHYDHADARNGSSHAVVRSLLGVLIFLVICLILIVIWVNRRKVSDKMTPIVKNFKTSLQYSTIEKQEEINPEVNV